jgi:hypothetical protein
LGAKGARLFQGRLMLASCQHRHPHSDSQNHNRIGLHGFLTLMQHLARAKHLTFGGGDDLVCPVHAVHGRVVLAIFALNNRIKVGRIFAVELNANQMRGDVYAPAKLGRIGLPGQMEIGIGDLQRRRDDKGFAKVGARHDHAVILGMHGRDDHRLKPWIPFRWCLLGR